MSRNRSHSMNYQAAGPPRLALESEQQQLDETMFELKETLALMRYEWPQCLEESANPIEMAVSLLDDSSVGLAHKAGEFQDLLRQVQQTLRKVVNEHHEVFNNSVGSYNTLLGTLQDCQQDAAAIRSLLSDTTRDTHDRSDVLNDLNNTSARYLEMLEILDAMDAVNSVPAQVELLVAQKKVHEVYDVILGAYKVAEQYNLWSLSAMAAIRGYLETQLNNLFDMIVDELRSEIYGGSSGSGSGGSMANGGGGGGASSGSVGGSTGSSVVNTSSSMNSATSKSTLSTDGPLGHLFQTLAPPSPQLSSLKTLLTQSSNLEQYVYNSANVDIAEIADCFSQPVTNFLDNHLARLHKTYTSGRTKAIDYGVLFDSTLDSSTESFHYVYMLLHTAHKLHRLPQVLEILNNTNQHEYHSLINTTINETKLTTTQQLNKLAKIQGFGHDGVADFLNGNSFNDLAVVVLEALFGTVFVKSLAVLQRQKVVSEIARVVFEGDLVSSSGSGVPTSSNTNGTSSINSVVHSYFDNAWNTMKKELQTLILNYIDNNSVFETTSGTSTLGGQTLGGTIHQIVRNDTFRFEDVSYNKSGKSADELKSILLEMFPGFNLNENGAVGSMDLSPYLKNESFNAMVEVLVPRNVFNMRIVLESFLVYVAGAHTLFSKNDSKQQSSSSALNFFVSFMRSSFLPKLDATLGGLLEGDEQSGTTTQEPTKGANSGLEPFKTNLTYLEPSDDGNDLTGAMVYQNAVDFRRMFTYICFVLNTSLTYREDFGGLCLRYLGRFAQSYTSFYRDLLEPSDQHTDAYTNGKPSLQINTWMKTPALSEASKSILNDGLEESSVEAIEREILLMIENKQPEQMFQISKDDFLDGDAFAQVCHLVLTASWILTWLPGMRKESNYTVYDDDDDVKLSEVDKLKHDWSFLENGRSNGLVDGAHVFLTLNSETVGEFDSVVEQFQTIRDHALLVLRYDLRCKAIYYVGRSYQMCEWAPTSEPGDCDQYISEYNKQVFLAETRMGHMLTAKEHQKMFSGLPEFIEQLILRGLYVVQKMNAHGIKRVLLNIFVLQQMLRSVMQQPEIVNFTRSSIFFEYFTANEHAFIEKVKERNALGIKEEDWKNLVRLIYSEKLAEGGGSSFNRTKYSELLRKVSDSFKEHEGSQ